MKLYKLREHSQNLSEVVNIMCDRHVKVYNIELCEQQTRQYCIDYTFVMVNDKAETIGFASVSRIDTTFENWLFVILSYIINLFLQRVFVYDVFILPEYRKRGNGKELIRLILKEIQNKYVLQQTIFLHCKPSLITFYTSNNFDSQNIFYFNNEQLVLMKHVNKKSDNINAKHS